MYPVEAGFRTMFIRRARQTLRRAGPVVIGITGSYGKTSTKEYLAHILNGRYRVLATPKSYNTLMGVCLVINSDLASGETYDYFIVEMGAYVGRNPAHLWLPLNQHSDVGRPAASGALRQHRGDRACQVRDHRGASAGWSRRLQLGQPLRAYPVRKRLSRKPDRRDMGERRSRHQAAFPGA
jgi:hypothetical protein